MAMVTASTGCVAHTASPCAHKNVLPPQFHCTKPAQVWISRYRLDKVAAPTGILYKAIRTGALSGSSNDSTGHPSDTFSNIHDASDLRQLLDAGGQSLSNNAANDSERCCRDGISSKNASIPPLSFLLPSITLAVLASSHPAFAASILASASSSSTHSASSGPQMPTFLQELFSHPSLLHLQSPLTDRGLPHSPTLPLPHSLPLLLADSDLSSQSSLSLFQWLQSQLQTAVDLAASSGPAGPAIFISAYILAAVLFIPGSVLTLAAGYLYGPLQGTAVVSVASTAAAAIAFLIARYIARPIVAQQLAVAAGGRFSAVDRAVAEGGWRIVLLCRLSPLFPFALSNYLFGVTGIGFWEYVGASWIGMLPGTFTYVYLGGAGRATVDAVAGGGGDVASSLEPAKVALYAVGAIATLLVTREVSKRAGAALDEAAAKEKEGSGDGGSEDT